jgi:hypothetical protein
MALSAWEARGLVLDLVHGELRLFIISILLQARKRDLKVRRQLVTDSLGLSVPTSMVRSLLVFSCFSCEVSQ